MDVEEIFSNNIKNNYVKALSKKIILENIIGNNFYMRPKHDQSVYLWGNKKNMINIKGKFNHLFLYNCDNVYLKIEELVSGITCIGCNNCDIYFRRTPLSTIEVSNSYGISIRSLFYNMPILFNSIRMNVIKSKNYEVTEYYNIIDGLYSNWKYKFFNF